VIEGQLTSSNAHQLEGLEIRSLRMTAHLPQTHTNLRARVVSYAMGAYKVFIECCHGTSKRAHSIGNLKG
jgi:hypothetical protein